MFLANENFPRPSIALLRNAGFLVVGIQEDFPGVSDERVLALATAQQLIILTFDKDYGEIIFHNQYRNPPAVIFFREKGNTPMFAGEILLKLLHENSVTLADMFTVVERQGIRQRSYSR